MGWIGVRGYGLDSGQRLWVNTVRADLSGWTHESVGSASIGASVTCPPHIRFLVGGGERPAAEPGLIDLCINQL